MEPLAELRGRVNFGLIGSEFRETSYPVCGTSAASAYSHCKNAEGIDDVSQRDTFHILGSPASGASALAGRGPGRPADTPPQAVGCSAGLDRIEALLPSWPVLVGRPPAERAALARAFVAKAVFNFPTTRLLITLLASDKTLRQLCGWQRASDVPSEATFSRAFAEFADSALPSRLHEALIQ